MDGGISTGGDDALDILKFPIGINTADSDAVDDYYQYAIRRATVQKAYTAIQRNFDADQGRVLDVFNGGRYIGFIDESEGMCDVYIVEDTESGGRALNRDSLAFEAAARLMHSFVMGEYVETPHSTVNPNVGLGFGLDI